MKNNPLPCGCGVYGTQKIDVNTGRIYYENQFVKHCEAHSNALGELHTLRTRLAAAESAQKALRDLVLELNEHHTIRDLHIDVVSAVTAANRVLDAALLAQPAAAEMKPECNHVWMSNMKQGWKVCDKCGERRDIIKQPAAEAK